MEPRAAPGTTAMAIRAATQKQRSARKRSRPHRSHCGLSRVSIY
jgi:hypothetical protein